MSPTITALTPYQGSDPATGEEFKLDVGEARIVSDAKADQLKRDYPDDFEFDDAGELVAVSPPASGGTAEGPAVDVDALRQRLGLEPDAGVDDINDAIAEELQLLAEMRERLQLDDEQLPDDASIEDIAGALITAVKPTQELDISALRTRLGVDEEALPDTAGAAEINAVLAADVTPPAPAPDPDSTPTPREAPATAPKQGGGRRRRKAGGGQ